MTNIFDLLFVPLGWFSDTWALVIISIISGIFFLLLYGLFSSQSGLRNTKRKIHAHLLEAILYRHSIKTSLKAQWKMFLYAFVYVGYALPPILLLMIPCLVILAQLNLRFNSDGLKPGQAQILSVQLEDRKDLKNIALSMSSGLKATKPVRVLESKQAFWRLEAQDTSPQWVEVTLDNNEAYKKIIPVGSGNEIVPSSRAKSWLWAFLYPGEEMLPKTSKISEIFISYPERDYDLFGMNMHWLVIFALVSIISGLVGSRIFSVEI